MSRLIDADILIAELKESAFHHCNNPREDSLLQRDRVIVRAQPTVKAIPLDRVEQIRNEIEKLPKYIAKFTDCTEIHICKDSVLEIIDNAIKEHDE